MILRISVFCSKMCKAQNSSNSPGRLSQIIPPSWFFPTASKPNTTWPQREGHSWCRCWRCFQRDCLQQEYTKRYQKQRVGETVKGKHLWQIGKTCCDVYSKNSLAKTPWCFTITGIAKRKNMKRPRNEAQACNGSTKIHGLGTITIAICLIWCLALIGVANFTSPVLI